MRKAIQSNMFEDHSEEIRREVLKRGVKIKLRQRQDTKPKRKKARKRTPPRP